MTVKTRLAKLEATHAATVKREGIKLISTPETRAQAAAELDVWRRSMVGEGWFSNPLGPTGTTPADVEAQLAEMREHDAYWVEHGHHKRPV